ncbi:hypothetical protein Pcinc_002750 [Petrolisthes cinctipes]|uniref:Nitrilase and fragile histidine triad fusion protein NitFhit n=1 Tax=Petrolisthes cinctipes TaxID=88211 RepID=A0AAE1GKB6_PETCI|nr:hypothetical protein Pcinc_002750 [Petrolisthes cinctipes]
MTSTGDKEKNFETCAKLVSEAAHFGAKMVFLPEGCDYIAESKEESVSEAESLSGSLVGRYQELARMHGVWLSLGGIHIKESGEDKVSNTHLLLDPQGVEAACYAKTHLFSVHIPDRNLHLREDTYVAPGSAIHPPTSTPAGNLALGICYDLRFAEFGLLQREMGAEVLTFPSAFTVPTGLAHWEALLRARAIETQCYVVAAAQTGQHNKKRASFGHAMIVDPWGAVVCQTSEGVGVAVARIDLGYLHTIRREMPVMSHRRHDLYRMSYIPDSIHLGLVHLKVGSSRYLNHKFGSVEVPGSCVFLQSHQSIAFVNKRPFTPGHVLLCPKRDAARLVDLTSPELSDLAQLTQATVNLITTHCQTPTVQIAIQDGPAAGQTIQHLHLHVLPFTPHHKLVEEREVGLQGHDEDGERQWRDVKEMEEEAEELKNVVNENLNRLTPQEPSLPRLVEVVEGSGEMTVDVGDMVVSVPREAIFLRTRFCCAFVAPEPVLPGHVYICSVQEGSDVEEEEGDISGGYGGVRTERAVDLLMATQLLQQNLERLLQVQAATVIIFSHHSRRQVQVQMIPRSPSDLPNSDDVYQAVWKHQSRASCWSFTHHVFTLAHQLREAIHSP